MLTFAPQFRKTGVSSKTIERQDSRRVEIARGLRDGIPIALGYFAVAFSLGIIAKKAGQVMDSHFDALGIPYESYVVKVSNKGTRLIA